MSKKTKKTLNTLKAKRVKYFEGQGGGDKRNLLQKAKDKVVKAGQKAPTTFGDGEEAYLKMLEMPEVDAVLIATPWTWHVPMAVAAMRAGKFAATEVCGATDIQECWDLVNAYEETGVPCMFLER